MRIPLIVISVLLILVISGCTSGTMYYADSGQPVDVQDQPTDTTPEPEVNETVPEPEEPADLCLNVTCENSTLTCQDGFDATCLNTCDSETGECSNCTPDCTGHQDLCANVTCAMTRLECPDGAPAACRNTCDPETGECSNCTPDCTGHIGCIPDWECTAWSVCLDGEQNRTCTDDNDCDTLTDKPDEERDCEINETDHVVFSQVLYDAVEDAEEEWFELYNPTDSSVELDGWVVSDNTNNWTIPNGTTISSNNYLIISRNSTAFHNIYGCSPDLGDLTLSLSNSGDYLVLWNGSTEVDFVAWGDGHSDWTSVTARCEGNCTIKRLPPEQDTDSPEDWFSDQAPDPDC